MLSDFRFRRMIAITEKSKVIIAATIITATSTAYNGVGLGEDFFGVGDDGETIGVGEGVDFFGVGEGSETIGVGVDKDLCGVGDGRETLGVGDGEGTIGVGEEVIAKVALIV